MRLNKIKSILFIFHTAANAFESPSLSIRLGKNKGYHMGNKNDKRTMFVGHSFSYVNGSITHKLHESIFSNSKNKFCC